MNHVVNDILLAMSQEGLTFSTPPIVIGGRAMEWYGLRQSGADIDLVVTEADYRRLAATYPEKRKDIYGDLTDASAHAADYQAHGGTIWGGRYDSDTETHPMA